MAVTLSTPVSGFMKFTLTGAASAANAGLGSIANPEGALVGITRVFAYFRTGSTGAANLDMGITTAAAKASDICSAQDVIEATVGGKFVYEPAAQAAETESPTAKWAADTFLTITGSASTAGLDADVFVEYVRLA